MRKHKLRNWKTAAVLTVAVAAVAVWAATSLAASHAATVKVAIMTDCKGAFAFGYEQDIGGAQAAFAKWAHGKAVNKSKPSAGMTGINVNGTPIKIVGYGCGNDTVPLAVTETKRLMEKLGADVMIGPLSGDEAVYVANYAKATQRRRSSTAPPGRRIRRCRSRRRTMFRYHGDGAQWNAGIGEIAYKMIGWRKAAIIEDDYSFGWTSAAGIIADFCAVGGQIVKRVFPPLNTTDYAPFVRQLPPPNQVDGYFSTVGGTGTSAMLKAYEQAYGKIEPEAVDRQPVLRLPRRRQDRRSEGDRLLRRRFRQLPGPQDAELRTRTGRSSTRTYPSQDAAGRCGFVYNYYIRRLGARAGAPEVRGRRRGEAARGAAADDQARLPGLERRYPAPRLASPGDPGPVPDPAGQEPDGSAAPDGRRVRPERRSVVRRPLQAVEPAARAARSLRARSRRRRGRARSASSRTARSRTRCIK